MIRRLLSYKPKIVLVRGSCGAGKSHYINQHSNNAGIQVINFNQFLTHEWWERPGKAIKLIDKSKKTVYIEAIFGPRSPSFKMMIDSLQAEGFKDISCIVIHRPLADCEAGIRQGDPAAVEDRLEILYSYWNAFEQYPVKNKLQKVSNKCAEIS